MEQKRRHPKVTPSLCRELAFQVPLSTALAADCTSSPAPRTVLQATSVAIALEIRTMLNVFRSILLLLMLMWVPGKCARRQKGSTP